MGRAIVGRMELVYSPCSGNSARALYCLFESGATWQPRRIDPRVKENHSAEYLALNPMGKVPALKDGSLVLWESNAINLYVAEKNPGARLMPTSLAGRASMQRWMFFQAGHITPAAMNVVRLTNTRAQEFWKFKGDPAAAEQGKKELARFLPVLESALADRQWLEHDFSLADIAYAPHLSFLAEGGFDFTPYPRLHGWLERLLERPAWKLAEELMLDI
jgi:glutathione S-transferase